MGLERVERAKKRLEPRPGGAVSEFAIEQDWTGVERDGLCGGRSAVAAASGGRLDGGGCPWEDAAGERGGSGVAILPGKRAPILKAELVEMIFDGNATGAVALLRVVLKAGPDPNSKDQFGEPLVDLTHTFRGVEKLRLLAEHGAGLNVVSSRTDRPRWSALMTAIYMQSWAPAVFLLAHGRSPKPAFLVLRGEMVKRGLSERGR